MVTCLSVPIAKTDSSFNRRVLLFFGSPRAQGHTARLLEHFWEALPEDNLEVQKIDAYQARVSPCIHCGDCEKTPSCRFHDMDEIDRLLRAADLLLFATPVYSLGFPAALKAVLDRFQRYYAERFFLKKRPLIERQKKAVLLTVSGSADESGAQNMAQALTRQFTVMNTKLVGRFHWPDTDRRTDISEKEKQALCQLGKDWLRD